MFIKTPFKRQKFANALGRKLLGVFVRFSARTALGFVVARLTVVSSSLFVRARLSGRLKLAGMLALVVISLGITAAATFTGAQPGKAAAFSTTTSTLNFQARLMNATGSIVPDGNYNVEFKLYNVLSSSGSSQGSCTGDTACEWTETYTSANAVQVKNGYLTVNLGSLTAFGAINWDQQQYISMRVGGTGTPSWDPEMTSRLLLTAIPYAFKAGQLAQYNNTNGFESTLSIVQPTVGNQTFQIPDQGAAGTYSLLTTNTANNNYIQNQNASSQTANFRINGSGQADTAFLTPAINTASAGTLSLGTGATSSAVSISKSGAATTVNGTLTVSQLLTGSLGLTVSGAAINLNASSNFATNINTGTSSGALSLGNASSQLFLQGNGATATSNIIDFRITGDTQPRFNIDASGKLYWGPGNGATDTDLYRSSAGVLKTDSQLRIGGVAFTSTPVLGVGIGTASNQGIIVKGASSQSGNLIELQDNSANVNAAFNSTGAQLTLGNATASGTIQGILRVTDGTSDGFFGSLQLAGAIGSNQTYSLPTTGGTLCMQGSTSCNFAPTTGGTGYIQNQSVSAQTANFFIQSAASGSIGAIIQGASGQTADLQQWQNSIGTSLAKVKADGSFVANYLTGNSGAYLNTGYAGGIALINQGVSSQTGDLIQNQNANGALLSGFNANGGLYTNGTNNTFGSLAVPVITSPSTTGTSFYYEATATNAAGETTASNVLAMNANTSVINWTKVPGATGYKIYRNTTNSFTAGSLLLTTITNGTTVTYTDTGSATSAGLPPTAPTGTTVKIQGWNGQTANYIDIQNAAGTSIFNVDQSGNINSTGSLTDFTTNSAFLRVYGIAGGGGTVVATITGTSGQTADDLRVQDSSTNILFSVSATGSVATKTMTNSPTGFVIQDSTAVALFTADTSNERIYVGPTAGDTVGALLVLGNKTNTGDPTGVEGAMYYNNADKLFRCYADSTWVNCDVNAIDHSYSIEDDFLAGGAGSGALGALGWGLATITTAATPSYNNADTIAPTADRPGVLRLVTAATAGTGSTLNLSTGAGSTFLGAGQTYKSAVAYYGNGGANSPVLRVGTTSGLANGTRRPNGLWWEADSTASAYWEYCYGNGSSAVCAPSTVAIADNTWARIEIDLTSIGAGTSSAVFKLNGISYSVSGATIGTALTMYPQMQCVAGSAKAQNCYIDYYQLTGITSAPR